MQTKQTPEPSITLAPESIILSAFGLLTSESFLRLSDSPVKLDSSQTTFPSTKTPSIGNISPYSTINISPDSKLSMLIF